MSWSFWVGVWKLLWEFVVVRCGIVVLKFFFCFVFGFGIGEIGVKWVLKWIESLIKLFSRYVLMCWIFWRYFEVCRIGFC